MRRRPLAPRITEPEFLDQFAGAKAPVYLPGMTVEAADASGESGASGAAAEESAAAEAGGAAQSFFLTWRKLFWRTAPMRRRPPKPPTATRIR